MDLPNLVKMGTPTLSGLLAEQIIQLAPGELDTVFFTNCGAEGVETAVKFARAATGRKRMLFTHKAFHGLTLGALSINGNSEFRSPFEPLLPDCTQIPFNHIDALEYQLKKRDVAAFIVEPIQGKGVQIPDDDYLPLAQKLCRKYDTLFILDEVQTGYGRTGKMFAAEHWLLEPDILVTAKGLSGGYIPVGAVLYKRSIYNKVFSSMDKCVVHSTTFGQNDLAMAAGLATLHVLRNEHIIENADHIGRLLLETLRNRLSQYEMIRDIRGRGLMIAIEFKSPTNLTARMGWSLLHKLDQSLFPQAVLIPLLKDHRILAQVAGHHMDIIKLIPPLVINKEDVHAIADAFQNVVATCHKFPGPIWELTKKLSSQAFKQLR